MNSAVITLIIWSGYWSTIYTSILCPDIVFFPLYPFYHDEVCKVMPCLATFQLKSNPSAKEQKEAQSQLTKSDEIQRLVAQARSSFSSQDYVTAAAQLDTIIEVRYLVIVS